jgi:hypothetical protein
MGKGSGGLSRKRPIGRKGAGTGGP